MSIKQICHKGEIQLLVSRNERFAKANINTGERRRTHSSTCDSQVCLHFAVPFPLADASHVPVKVHGSKSRVSIDSARLCNFLHPTYRKVVVSSTLTAYLDVITKVVD